MKILQILDERWDSGLTDYGLTLAQGLKEAGQEVFVAGRRGSPTEEHCLKRGWAFWPLGNPLSLRSRVAEAGVAVVNAHTGSGHSLGYLACLGRGVALVRTRADARPVCRRWGQGMLFARTDAIVGASNYITGQYRALYPRWEERCHTLYPGLPVFPRVEEPQGPVRVALVGRLDPVKGHRYFLEAIGLLKGRLVDQRFLVSGEDRNVKQADLRLQAGRLGVEPWVEFSRRQDDVRAFMRSSHAGVVASVGSEAVSRVCLEWMAEGRPLAAAAVGCLPEFISTGENGFLVAPRNPGALAQALWALLQNTDERRRMGKGAHHLALDQFSLPRFVERTLRVYEEALRRRGRGQP